MAIHAQFPKSPHAVAAPEVRWVPGDDLLAGQQRHHLMPPLVAMLREHVKSFRDSGYANATPTSRHLLNWWFNTPHQLPQHDGPDVPFQYFFAQREALETIVYLMDVRRVKGKLDLMHFDEGQLVRQRDFEETWLRFVVKMATGSGKTKVMSLALAWSFFHRSYEEGSELARNFLVIAPNIIVLDRLSRDFDGLRIFFQDPVLPPDGYEGRAWRSDFQLKVHKQDDVRARQATGNIFLTNVHRVYMGSQGAEPSAEDEDTRDYFLGPRPTGKTNDSKTDLGEIVREVDELMVINDEAHHIHDSKLSWFQSIREIDERLRFKDRQLSLQLDVTATPKHNNGAIFVQTICDYPLVEAIWQNVVKHPVVPDEQSRAQLREANSEKFAERYADYLRLGVIEWKRAFEEHRALGKKAVLFVMTDDTKNCDEVAEFLRGQCPELEGEHTFVIHTKKNGEISETQSGKNEEELRQLRQLANSIDAADHPARAIVSVLMLKEGWDVRNVTTIVGLRPYSAASNILPEQTLGRGLRKMYDGETQETVSVLGTPAFMEFVESIREEGVELERAAMGEGAAGREMLRVEVDDFNAAKDLDALDIEIPVLGPRFLRHSANLSLLKVDELPCKPLPYKTYTAAEQRNIEFHEIITDDHSHTSRLDVSTISDYQTMVGFFARTVMRNCRLTSGYDKVYPAVKRYIGERLYGRPIDFEAADTLRNLSEPGVTIMVVQAFKEAVNRLAVEEVGVAGQKQSIRLRQMQPFLTRSQDYARAKKSVFNYTVGDSGLEVDFALWLDGCADVAAFGKNYPGVHFRLDYLKADGTLSEYLPDFFVRLTDGRLVVVETKGIEDLDVAPKMARLRQWCADVNHAQIYPAPVSCLKVREVEFRLNKPATFAALMTMCDE